MKIKIVEYIKRKLFFVYQTIGKLNHKKQLLISSDNELVDFNLRFIQIGDETKYFRTPKK